MKRLVILALVTLMLVGAGGCQNTIDKGYVEPVIMYIAGVGNLDDGAYNARIIDGLKKGARALKFDLKILQSNNDENYRANLKVATAAKPNMIIGASNFAEDLIIAANTNPNIDFAVIDGDIADDGRKNLPANFMSMNFDNAEGAFLMGTLAASANTTTCVGFVGGADISVVKDAEIGYKAGVTAVAPNMTVVSTILDSFSDKEKAAQAAAHQKEQDAGIVFGFAGGANYGIIENAAQVGYWAMGVDQDQAVAYPQFSQSILCSMVKNVDIAAYDVAKMHMDKSFKSGVKTYGVADGGITLGTAGGNITPELFAVYDQWKKEITEGTIKVPRTQEALEAFGIAPE